MASKKVFTSLAFQSGANLIAPKVEAITPEANLTTPTDNSNYYTGSAGQLAYNNGNIWVNNDSIWTKVLNHASTATISGSFTFDRVDGNSAGIAPFIIGSESTNVLVAGLNADQVDGSNTSNAVGNNTIPVRDSSSLFHVGATSYYTGTDFTDFDAVTATQVANKALVDAAVAKLVEGAPNQLATLDNLAAALNDDTAFSTTITTALGNRLQIDVNDQGLSATQLTNARTNLGLGALATLATVGASEITNGSVDTAELAEDAVDNNKLDNSASFTMGGLTVNGDTSLVAALPLKLSRATYEPIHFGFTSDGSNHHAYLKATSDSATYQLTQLRFGVSEAKALTLTDNNKIGIGVDATQPSGTLHISTARYGADIITGDNADFSVGDETAANSIKYGWEPYGSNTLAISNEQLVITNIDNNSTGYRYLTPTTIGRKYKAQIDAKYTGSGSAAVLQLWNGSSMVTVATLTTSLVTYTATFERVASAPYWKFGTASGQSVTIDNLSLVEASLATTPSTTADDLVINNGLSQAGMTLLGSGGTRIHFGESGHAAQSAIVNTYNDTKNSTLKFQACATGGTAADVLSLYGADQSAKFEGGVGINGRAASATSALEIKSISSSSANSGINIQSNSGNHSVVMLGEKSTEGGRLHLAEEGETKISFYSDGTTNVINAGNLAIGNTSAACKLEVNTTPDADAITLRTSTADTLNHTTGIRFQYNSAVPAAIRARLTDVSSGTGALGFYTSATSPADVSNLTNRFEISSRLATILTGLVR